MGRIIKIIVFVIIQAVVVGFLFVSAGAATPPVSITLSRVGSSSSQTYPGLLNPVNVTGIMIDGQEYIDSADISTYFPCTVTSYTSYMQLTINGQTTRAYKNSTYYQTTVSYSVYQTPTVSKTYRFFGCANLDHARHYAARYYNSKWYVAIDIFKPLGVLHIHTNDLLSYNIYDFRLEVYPYGVSDNNTYIVGGPWITSGYCYQIGTSQPSNTTWYGMRLHNLAPNFKISEMQDHSKAGSNPEFYTSLKVAKDLLSSAQQIRYEILGGSPLSLSCAYRTWVYNKQVGSNWDMSFHMRGRAFDAPEDSLFDEVYDYFSGYHGDPIQLTSSFWRRQPEVSSYGDEIEDMPVYNNNTNQWEWWLHMQVDPSMDSSVAPSYP